MYTYTKKHMHACTVECMHPKKQGRVCKGVYEQCRRMVCMYQTAGVMDSLRVTTWNVWTYSCMYIYMYASPVRELE